MRNGLLALGLIFGACGTEANLGVRQGSDTWSQAPNNEVDILFVVDNSGTMVEEQASLGLGFSSFVNELESTGTDFHIGVISTTLDYADPLRGSLIGEPAFLTPTDNYVDLFNDRVRVGTEGADKEKGLEAAVVALSPAMTISGPNAGFLRSQAQLLVVFVSDEDDCSDAGALEGQSSEECYYQREQLTPVSELTVALRQVKQDPDLLRVGAIIGKEASVCQDSYFGQRYQEVADFTGGLVGDICEPDWSGIMSQLGLESSGIRSAFQLTRGAIADSLVVVVNDVEQVQGVDYLYEPETWFVRFFETSIPPRDAVIEATYTIDPGATSPAQEGQL